MNKILFLCTGNYYRSRFAEHLFNQLATKQGLNWQADSRGLALERGVNNVGAISQYATEALAARLVNISDDERFPKPACEPDFQSATRVIALDEAEHRPLMNERFPQWVDAIEYWLVHDIDKTSATEALGQIEKHLLQLIEQLTQS
ncbi:protein tyrosine phosphatase [Trichormus variabilis ATCC 29413]|uniref:Protein tyrosine phosphatase n=2 Tax=Anabaena variabilis TaxID=264691 RepID=Q3M6K1_TRIV2|nr:MULTISPECIES: low molecular weight phosphatase family protein [Nostocaceae]ABA23385.1 protein tyrosine phosphatase [Trichormus variabilis ATCC 29413]MBC1215131.1 low molecular weight phosphatase family protein [Trichormus variabilis ARAD]MBC1255458.1 low molecular weight phosphatase family protein [Trichormus variabilis V5]MBC1268207.1 low molecular weight phosphatase family protein [Trichormus variabilis FSR]MBC1303780.1 low molecular weight phosphatase family protein [Trichormus variabili